MKDQPAFPHEVDDNYWPGLTLRDYFAARVLQALVGDQSSAGTPQEFATYAYTCADAMLKARDEK